MTHRLGTTLAFAALIGLVVTLGCQPSPEAPAAATIPAVADDTEPPIAVPPEDLKALVEANNAFAIDLYKKIAEKETGNIFFSPYSIHAALSMTYAGARGETAAEMAKVLGIEKLGDRVHPAQAELARKLKSDGGKDKPEFHVANALWGQKGLGFRPEFLSLTKRNYGSGFRELDFASDTEGSRQTINKWVSDQTQEKIPELLKSEVLDPSTQLVLTNAIYFKGAWSTPFLKGETKDAPFEVSPTEKIPVTMMQTQEAHFNYSAADDSEWLELTYKGGRHSMILILPKRGRFAAVEKTLTAFRIREEIAKLRFHTGKVFLPKFQVCENVKLDEELKRLGMPLTFSDNGDFSGMTGSCGLRIGSVIHEAFLKVDEFGSEAAAATAVVMMTSVSPPFSFIAERPFLVVIHDNLAGNILFSGRVVKPGK